MGQYRIEVSPNNRAGCKDTLCKADQVKITKGEIRFGTWVEIHEHGSWGWKHWGCVSGAQILHLREACEQGGDEYDFDAIDGYDELGDHPEIQEKIRRCIKQGHIDPEDFKGDPEKNVLGEKGIHLTAKQKAKKEQEAADTAAEEASGDEAPAKKKTAKRAPKKAAAKDEASGDEAPTKKTAKRAPKKAAVKDEASGDEAPAKKKTAKRAPKKADAKVKAEVTDTTSEEDAPVKKTAAKRGRKKADDEGADDEKPAAKKAKTSKGAKPVKAEEATPAKPRGKAAVKKEAGEGESTVNTTKEEETPAKKTRKAPAKAKATPKAKEPAKARGKAAVKTSTDEDETVDTEAEPAAKTKGRRVSKGKPVAAEPDADADAFQPRRGRSRKSSD